MTPPGFAIIATVVMISLHMTAPLFTLVGLSYRNLGLGFVVLGVGIVLFSARAFRRLGTTIHPFEQASSLATRGLYRLSRNPMYLGMLCALVGIAIRLGSVTPALVPAVFMWLITERFIKREEKQLEYLFGDRYVQYKQGVRRWF